MSSLQLENSMSSLFCRHLYLEPDHICRLSCASTGLILAGTTQLSKVARWVRKPGQQTSRIQFLRRLLASPRFSQEAIYQPLLRQALAGYHEKTWHIVIDRSNLVPHECDLLMVSLAFRKRAIPIVWQIYDFGCTGSSTQIALLEQVLSLVPQDQAVIVHGDTEFGSVAMMRFCRKQNWNFIFGQISHTYYKTVSDDIWHYLGDLFVTPRQPAYRSNILWTKAHEYGPLNLFAFYAPHQNGPSAPRCDIRYQVTSLPITHTLRRIGKRRWCIEPMFRDYKSSGWHVHQSALEDVKRRICMLSLLSINYLWATCIGRWLCKTGRRHEIDAKGKRHYSLFRIGWDWIIHRYTFGEPIPPILTLYA